MKAITAALPVAALLLGLALAIGGAGLALFGPPTKPEPDHAASAEGPGAAAAEAPAEHEAPPSAASLLLRAVSGVPSLQTSAARDTIALLCDRLSSGGVRGERADRAARIYCVRAADGRYVPAPPPTDAERAALIARAREGDETAMQRLAYAAMIGAEGAEAGMDAVIEGTVARDPSLLEGTGLTPDDVFGAGDDPADAMAADGLPEGLAEGASPPPLPLPRPARP